MHSNRGDNLFPDLGATEPSFKAATRVGPRASCCGASVTLALEAWRSAERQRDQLPRSSEEYATADEAVRRAQESYQAAAEAARARAIEPEGGSGRLVNARPLPPSAS